MLNRFFRSGHWLRPASHESSTKNAVLFMRENISPVVLQSTISVASFLNSTQDGVALEAFFYTVQFSSNLLCNISYYTFNHCSQGLLRQIADGSIVRAMAPMLVDVVAMMTFVAFVLVLLSGAVGSGVGDDEKTQREPGLLS
uniref:Uncharacterized protein n=1 Tax=Rhipicephalus microplus TaxID=6941 RepID=A0A6G5AFB9_RHIMP